MKHKGVKIVRVEYLDHIDIGKREDSPVKSVFKYGWAPVGINFPMEKNEALKSVETLITQVMEKCYVTEKEAVKLINEN